MLAALLAKLGISVGIAAAEGAATSVVKSIPWKWIAAACLAIAIGGVVFAGYEHVRDLTKDLEVAKAAAAEEQVLKNEAIARANELQKEQADQVERINDLEAQRSKIAVEVTTLRTTMQNLDLEQDIQSDDLQKADAAIKTLNARNAQLNRLLSNASGGGAKVRANTVGAAKASPPSSPNFIQRTLQALRPNGVSDGK
jgi:hypothetical protein